MRVAQAKLTLRLVRYDVSPYREFVQFALMLSGMAARVLSTAIERRSVNGNKLGPIAVDRWEFVYPMLFAVPTFGALLIQDKSGTLELKDAILAFQTGFFWQTILKRDAANSAQQVQQSDARSAG